jgi:hypothetical protein
LNPVSTAWNTGIGTDPTPLTADFTNWIPTPNSALLITLDPPTDTNEVGTTHTVTATILDGQGQGVQGIEVTFEVISGPNTGDTNTDTTDSNGEATFTYTGAGGSGTDVIQACYDDNGFEVCSRTVTKVWNIVSDLDITLDPPYDLNVVGEDHTVTATVTDSGSPILGVSVSFTVIAGPNVGDNGVSVTNVNGNAIFTYTGNGGVGTDLIQACFIVPNNDGEEICSNIVEKEWVEELITVTPLFASNILCTGHTVTALLTDSKGNPLPGIYVTFTVTAGPNSGDPVIVPTDGNGEATFTYTGNGGVGQDEILACFTNTAGTEVCEELAYKEWAQVELTEDSLLFPWVVRSDDVTTVISVVNTAQTWAESVGLPFHDNRIHIEYWHKLTTANDQEEKCREYNFEVTSSKDDMVTWDMGGHFNNGLPLFNDTSNEVIGVPDMTLAVENPRRAFLIVDIDTDALNDAGTNVDGTMYGEATIIEHRTGAAWGYIAYNAIGGPNDFSDAGFRDQQGEVIGGYETTQTTLLNPNDAITKLFVTPTSSNQGQGNLNVRVQLCRFPEIDGDGDPYTGDCESGGIWNNEEGGFSFTEEKNIVCTTADEIVDFFGGAGTSAYTQWEASGKAGWAYIVTHWGNIDARDGTDQFEEVDEAIIGKLEFGTGLNWDGSIADTINTFVWLRDNATYLQYCKDCPIDVRCAPGGINIVHNEEYQEEE